MPGDVTQLLSAIESGDPKAAEELLPLVYEELRRLAAARMAREKPGGLCSAAESIPGFGRASPSLHWEWTRRPEYDNLKQMLGLTFQVDQKVESGQPSSSAKFQRVAAVGGLITKLG